MKPKIYDSPSSQDFALAKLLEVYSSLGVNRAIYKILSPNDNSKNQPYFASHFTDIGFIPTGELIASTSNSTKTSDPKRQIKFTANLSFYWLSSEGQFYAAPAAKLIYYPQFPEVRFSGFLQGCQIDMGGWMDPSKLGRSEGRILVLGVGADGAIFGYLATPNSRIAKELPRYHFFSLTNVLREIPLVKERLFVEPASAVAEMALPYGAGSVTEAPFSDEARELLLREIQRIHRAGPIVSKRLNKKGEVIPYMARNGGGYTLEAELGIIPNGIAEPDFHGWEIKQFGVKRFDLINSKALTVMTPEPDGGVYRESGAQSFVRRYGYINENKVDRYDFTGRHFANRLCARSGLTLVTIGFDAESGKMVDANGCVGLLDSQEHIAASWSFAKLLEHWKTKHSKAAYIPSVVIKLPDGFCAYHYGNSIRLYEGTNINLLLKTVAAQKLYYDPGIKLENASSSKPKMKLRSQFRVKSSELDQLYDRLDTVDVSTWL